MSCNNCQCKKEETKSTEGEGDFVLLLFACIVSFVFYVVPSFIGFMDGLDEYHDAAKYNFMSNDCLRPMSRIEYIYPAFRFGCYMGQPAGGSNDENTSN